MLQAVEGLGVVKHQDHPAVVRTVVVDVVDELPDEQDILVERAAGRVSDLGVADEVLDGYVEALGDALCEDAVRGRGDRDRAVYGRVGVLTPSLISRARPSP